MSHSTAPDIYSVPSGNIALCLPITNVLTIKEKRAPKRPGNLLENVRIFSLSPLLDRLHKKMGACRACGSRRQPDVRVRSNTRETCGHVLQVSVETLTTALVFPIGLDFLGSVAKDRAKSVPYQDRVTGFLFDRIIEARGEHAAGSAIHTTAEMRPSAPQTGPSRLCRRHGYGEKFSSLATVDASSSPCTWPPWSARPRCRA